MSLEFILSVLGEVNYVLREVNYALGEVNYVLGEVNYVSGEVNYGLEGLLRLKFSQFLFEVSSFYIICEILLLSM